LKNGGLLKGVLGGRREREEREERERKGGRVEAKLVPRAEETQTSS
jgi:hypothetical protein